MKKMSLLASTMCSTVNSPTLQSWRERSPSSYSLKIQNFSQLLKSTPFSEENYQSSRFSSGGYYWRMIIYPRGNDKDEGSRFISMYVEIDTTSLTSKPSTEVFADLRFLIFNKKENKYFATQYVEAKPFNTLKTVWGLPQVLALDTFNDPKNGYLFDGDHCEIGVDVIVVPPPTNWEILSLNEKPYIPKFSWTVKNFSELKENCYKSSSFSMGRRNWVLHLYPKGNSRADGKWLSIYLSLAESETLKEDEKIFTQGHLRLIDPSGTNHLTHPINNWHTKSNVGWGYYQFVTLDELREAYLDRVGTLNVEIEFDVLSETIYSLQ